MAFKEDMSVFYDTDEFAVSAVYSYGNYIKEIDVFINKEVEVIGDNGVLQEKITAIELPSSLQVNIGGEFFIVGKSECYEVTELPGENDGMNQIVPVKKQ